MMVDDQRNPLSEINAAYQTREPRHVLAQDVILTENTHRQISECIALLRFHRTIYDEWDFAAVDHQGSTAIVNFFGPPGTGKTLAAEALAGELEMPFLPLTIGDLESSLKGQMSKNLQKAFRRAREEQAVLFFDEADALLGRRISVSQGIDSDMNATRNTMMTELSAHEGLVVFATNYARDYDDAIKSRITHQVTFELPDEATRLRLWDRFIVEKIPLAVPRAELLSQAAAGSPGLSGRDILNCTRRALPRMLLDAERAEMPPRLDFSHVEAAIAQVRLGTGGSGQAAKPKAAAGEETTIAGHLLGLQ